MSAASQASRSASISMTRPAAVAVEALADHAVAWVTDTIHDRYAQVLTPFGTTGRFQTRDDLYSITEFLSGAVELHAPAYFTDYVRWLAGLLKRRGLAVEMLAESLILLDAFLKERLRPDDLAEVAPLLGAALAALATAPDDAASLCDRPRPEASSDTGTLMRSLICGDTIGARALVLGHVDRKHDYVAVATRLLQPALYEIGTMWARQEITVAQEHLASVIVQFLLVELYLGSHHTPPPANGTRRKVLLAGVEKNRHAVGVQILADALDLSGCRVQLLGADTPTAALLAQVDAFAPDIVGLSASLVRQLPIMARTIAALRHEFGPRRPHIMVGGIAVNQFEGMWRRLGADAWSPDAEAALAELR